MSICYNCGQVEPETKVERRLAAERIAEAKRMKAAAMAGWEDFQASHPPNGFWAKHPDIGVDIGITLGIAVIVLMEFVVLPEEFRSFARLMLLVALAGAVALPAILLSVRQLNKVRKHYEGLKPLFCAQHSVYANWLGFDKSSI